MTPQHAATKPTRYGLVLLPQASLADYAITLDVLNAANQLAERKLYELLPLSIDGQAVMMSNGNKQPVDLPLEYAPKLDGLFLFADDLNADIVPEQLFSILHNNNLDKIPLISIGCASYWLAKMGLLNGYRATIHWKEIGRLTEECGDVIVSSNLYEIDRQRMSCAGGSATLDFVMTLIENDQGHDFVAELSELFSMERIRPSSERQRIPLATRIGGSQPKLTDAVSLMEANIEEPLSTDDISYYVGVSRRQLERLFKQYLGTVPSKYYLELRLNKAKQLLQQTSKSIVQIGLACGFSSGPHFSSTYRNHFGISPREERAQSTQSHNS